MAKNIEKYEQEISKLRTELEKYKVAVNELNTLNELAISAGRAADVDQMLNIIVKKTTKALDAEQGSIMLITEDQNNPLKTYLRQKEVTNSKQTIHVGLSITGWVLLHEEALVIDDLSRDERFDASEEEHQNIRALLCIPVWFEGRIIGLITMINKKGQKYFTKSDFTLLSIISVQAGQLIKNMQLQKETLEKQKETEKLQELDRIKTNFFNNISHEFRSPLTLILGPIEKLLEGKSDEEIKSELRLIRNNARRLLNLINQLLDLATIDAGRMKLKVEKVDIISFVKRIISYFEQLAESKNIAIEFQPQIEDSYAYLDVDKLEKIITNIIYNSLKFTNGGGEILVSVKEKQTHVTAMDRILELTIEDNGIGISPEDIQKIFNRFNKLESSRISEGTGIGLALVKELLELHYGSISVESELEKGTKFTIRLPKSKEFYLEKQVEIVDKEIKQHLQPSEKIAAHDSSPPKNIEQFPEDSPIVLIAEDQEDIRNFIKDNLISKYRIIETSSGNEGLEKSMEVIPDLIISDIVMPGMDGIELTKKIKTDFKTSHIPVIMLTARAAIESKLEGLETGADDYLTKPFNISELKIRVNNLIEQRKKLRERYRKEISLEPKDITITSTEDKFLNRSLEIMEQHISEPEFTVEQFASEIFMSRVQLHRKFIALTGQPPSDFMRVFRLKRAAKLLLNKHGNISEIAYDVGFTTPSYFAESFKKFFGRSPSDYIKAYKAQNSK